MKLFIDSANLEEINQAVRLGVISGATTNPSLVSKENFASYHELVTQICQIVPGPVSVEVVTTDVKDMIKQAKDISTWAPNVVVKIPATKEGVEATSRLSQEGIKVNMTLCFSLNQALLAALSGASYVSPFVGRLDDIGHDGMGLVAEMVELYKRYNFKTQVLAASIRHPRHVVMAAKAGADVATIPYQVLTHMASHPLTEKGLSQFLADWQSKTKPIM